MTPDRIHFGDFELDAANFTLRRGMTRIKLERIPMEALILLAHSKGRLVQRAELFEAIWGKDHFLESDTAINTAIRKLRQVLGDDSKHPAYIETVQAKDTGSCRAALATDLKRRGHYTIGGCTSGIGRPGVIYGGRSGSTRNPH